MGSAKWIRAPNVDGTLVQWARRGKRSTHAQVRLEQRRRKVPSGRRMPLDAKVGKWTIRKISFQTLAPAPERTHEERRHVIPVFSRRCHSSEQDANSLRHQVGEEDLSWAGTLSLAKRISPRSARAGEETAIYKIV